MDKEKYLSLKAMYSKQFNEVIQKCDAAYLAANKPCPEGSLVLLPRTKIEPEKVVVVKWKVLKDEIYIDTFFGVKSGVISKVPRYVTGTHAPVTVLEVGYMKMVVDGEAK